MNKQNTTELIVKKQTLGYKVVKEIKSGCINPKVEAGWHIHCPNCNKCNKFNEEDN